MTMKTNNTEQEVVLLQAVNELVDEMVNFEVLDLVGEDPDRQIVFHSSTHQKFFNILLADFLSYTDKKAFLKEGSFLGTLRGVCTRPAFDVSNSVASLRTATSDFKSWLDTEIEIDTWLPSIDTEAALLMPRFQFAKICGHLSKHSFLRSSGPIAEIQKLLTKSGKSISSDDALCVLADFYDRFHEDILNYHGSTLVAYLNDIRWGIHDYLQPELQRSFRSDGEGKGAYQYDVPSTITATFARKCYWDLMNRARSTPPVERFQVTKWLKLRY